MAPRRQSRSFITYILVVCVLGAIGFGAYTFLSDLDGPVITLAPDTGRVSPQQELSVTLVDAVSNIKSVVIMVRKSSGAVTILDRTFTTAAPRQTVTFNLKEAGLRDGNFDLEIKGRDTALAGFGRGNTTTRVWNLRLDTQPPRVSVRSTAPSLKRGSVTAVAYAVNEDVLKTGVQVGDTFFPGYKQPNGLYYCFIAFPIETSAGQFSPVIMAQDLAGNESRGRLIVHAQERAYRADTMNISDKFLNDKFPVLQEMVPQATTPLEAYVAVNKEVRLQNEAVLRELAKQSAPTMLWNGPFARLAGSAVMAQYGDNRTYKHNGQTIDQQTHMGLDLASVAKAPIPAANNGKVVYAEPLGIFGNLVVIDHGLGLMSLYSHMSEIQTTVGSEVAKGDIIGRTGTTGLAGGDHLHFGMLMGGLQVQPVDWYDKNWIKNTLIDRLTAAAK